MQIIVMGAGYVGLVTGVMLSHYGHNVICIDNDPIKIEQLNNRVLPIYEPELQSYFESSLDSGKVVFNDIQYGDKETDLATDVVFIAVSTPSKIDGSVDLTYVMEAIDYIVTFLNPKCLIVIKSTVPPGTCNIVKQYLHNKGYAFEIASNPEFLKEGSAVYDFLNPDRIIIGTSNKKNEEIFRNIYRPLVDNDIPLIFTDLNTSEFIKYVSNAFLALKIGFLNEVSDLCEIVGANINELVTGVGSDKRIGQEFLKVGPGFGGSCFPKDLLGLLKISESINIRSAILNAIIESNNIRPQNLVKKIQNILGSRLNEKKLCVLGLTFKKNTDDTRESPAIKIIQLLIELQAKIVVYDPQGMKNTKKLNLKIDYANNVNEGIPGADAILILTEWDEFKNIDFLYAYKNMNQPIIIDFRNILDSDMLKHKGFNYYSLGVAKNHE